MNHAGLSSDKLALEIPAAFARTARAVLLAKEGEDDNLDLVKVESKLRQQLGNADLPPPFDSAVLESSEGGKPKKARLGEAIEPDTLPPLKFHEGHVIEDIAVLARAKNLVLGCRVKAVGSLRCIRKGGCLHSTKSLGEMGRCRSHRRLWTARARDPHRFLRGSRQAGGCAAGADQGASAVPCCAATR